MLIYILKFSGCLALLLLFYKLFLERESIHVFKRFYLLGSLFFSLIVPLIIFNEYVEVAPAPEVVYSPTTEIETETIATTVVNVPPALEKDVLDIAPLLWGIYFLGVFLFGINFFKNLLQIFRRIRKNPKQKIVPFTRVLLRENYPPHTFFRYIFLNRQKLEANEIPVEVLVHEETHAKQKHSVDVLVIELLQVLLWFHPLIYFTRKSIKLNHEFLADNEVLKKGTDSSTYQNTLLSFMVPKTQNQPLANAINYSSIKKRFTVMKTRTSRKAILLKTSLILPLCALLVMGFSESRTIEIIKEDPIVNELSYTAEIIKIFIDSTGQIYLDNNRVALKDLSTLLRQFNTELSKKERENKVRAKIFPYDNTPDSIISEIEQILQGYGIAQIDIVGPEIVSFPASQNGATLEQLTKYNTLAKKYNAQPKEKRVIPAKDLKRLETIYRKMSKKQKVDAQPFPECPDPKSQQEESATGKQMAEYNALAKKYNKMLAKKGRIRIMKSDVDRLEYLHSIMTEDQRAKAEPFPDFPEPPEPPAPPSPPDKSEKETADEVIEEIIAHQDPYDVVGGHIYLSENQNAVAEFNIVDENVIIYSNGKEISYPEMEHLMKEGEIVNIDVSKKPKGKKIIRIRTKNGHTTATSRQNSEKNTSVFNYPYKSEGSNGIAIGTLNVPRGSVRVTAGERRLEEGIDYTVNYQAGTVQILDPSIEAVRTPIKIEVVKNSVEEHISNPPAPPAPPKPKAPLDYVIEMAKKDARFYYEGKEISSDKAIQLMKRNKNLNIDSRREKGKRPVVKLSTEPIVIDR